jgi:preprotein translocase SecE subunit
VAETKPDKKPVKKRIVKNPETFRERAIKASEGSDKPKRTTRVKSAGRKVTTPVTRPIAKAVRVIFYRKPFTWLRRPLRIIGKILLPSYIRQSWKELRLVTWPSWKESRDLTFAVIVFATTFGVIIALVDFGLDKLCRNVLLK